MSGRRHNGEINSRKKCVKKWNKCERITDKDSDLQNSRIAQDLDCHISMPGRPKDMQTSQNRTPGGGVLNLHPNVLQVLSQASQGKLRSLSLTCLYSNLFP